MDKTEREHRSERDKQWRKNNPEKTKEIYRKSNAKRWEKDKDKLRLACRVYHLKNKYGISIEHYERLLEKQGGVCAVCGTSNWGGAYGKPHVDHDHKTGVVRGILCVRCNVAIGLIDDSPDRALEIISYLRKFII